MNEPVRPYASTWETVLAAARAYGGASAEQRAGAELGLRAAISNFHHSARTTRRARAAAVTHSGVPRGRVRQPGTFTGPTLLGGFYVEH